jgi:VWFA-related protein
VSRRFLYVALALTVVAAPSAQQQPTPVFKGRVDLVTLDVTVVDKDGHPVADLKPDDFVITLDKQRRPVQLLDYQSFGGPARTDVAPGAASSQVSNVGGTAPTTRRGGRVVLFMFDDLSFRPGDGKGFIVAAERALDQFGFDDLVGVVTSSGMGPIVYPTRDRRVIAAAFHDKRLVGRYDDDPAGYYIAVNDSNAVQRECGLTSTAIAPPAGKTGLAAPTDETCPAKVMAAQRMLGFLTGRRVGLQLAAYSAAIRALGAAPAPRVLIVVSGGMPYNKSPFADAAVPLGIAREATEAGVQFFVLTDASEPTELAFPGVCPTVECNYLRAQAHREERRFLINGLDSLASEAGGQLLRTIGTPDHFYTRIIEETSGIYRLGVAAPEGANTNRFLTATVKVNRKGVTVQANRHALMPSVAATPVPTDDLLKSRLALGGAAFGVPIALATARRHDPTSPNQVQRRPRRAIRTSDARDARTRPRIPNDVCTADRWEQLSTATRCCRRDR